MGGVSLEEGAERAARVGEEGSGEGYTPCRITTKESNPSAALITS